MAISHGMRAPAAALLAAAFLGAAAHADVAPWLDAGTPLPNYDRSSSDELGIEPLHAQPLASAIPAQMTGATTLLMSHCFPLLLRGRA